jgi:hypothetical protein
MVLLDGTGGYAEDVSDEILPGSNAKRGHHHRHHPTSPNKRHRLTPRPQNIQRPCLDFEKMQQVQTYLKIVSIISYILKIQHIY